MNLVWFMLIWYILCINWNENKYYKYINKFCLYGFYVCWFFKLLRKICFFKMRVSYLKFVN